MFCVILWVNYLVKLGFQLEALITKKLRFLWHCLQLRQEKIELEETLEKEQEAQINKLMCKIEKLEADTYSKQQTLEQVSALH